MKVETGEEMDPEIFITALYRVCLGRFPDQEGMQHWRTMLSSGDPVVAVISGILESEEARRFLDRKKQSESSAPTHNDGISLRYTLENAFHQPAERDNRVAFVTCLPPQDTGISTCSLYSWLGFRGPMDIFCPVVDPDWFFALSTKFTEGNPLGPRLFDVDGFLTVDQVVKYKEVIIALGNSNHNCYVFALLKKVAEHGSLSRVTLYVHDPCLLNVLQIGLELSSSDMLSLMEQTYRRRVPVSIEEREDRGALQKALIKCGMLGNRYFLNAGITRYLVNSDAAATLLESDLHGGNVTIMRIFHPVFLPIENDVESPQASREEPKRIVVGTFGVPNQGKQTSLIAGAVRRLRERGADACLMIAGFQASLFVSAHRDLLADVEVEVYDGPTDRQLVNCMAKCDVAVQLRSTNLGESSGMVPQLLVLGKDVIVTGIGAFIEYGPCVKYVPTDVTEEALADAILDSLSAPIETSLKQAYVSQHSPERFQDAFCELFALPRSHTPERFVSVR